MPEAASAMDRETLVFDDDFPKTEASKKKIKKKTESGVSPNYGGCIVCMRPSPEGVARRPSTYIFGPAELLNEKTSRWRRVHLDQTEVLNVFDGSQLLHELNLALLKSALVTPGGDGRVSLSFSSSSPGLVHLRMPAGGMDLQTICVEWASFLQQLPRRTFTEAEANSKSPRPLQSLKQRLSGFANKRKSQPDVRRRVSWNPAGSRSSVGALSVQMDDTFTPSSPAISSKPGEYESPGWKETRKGEWKRMYFWANADDFAEFLEPNDPNGPVAVLDMHIVQEVIMVPPKKHSFAVLKILCSNGLTRKIGVDPIIAPVWKAKLQAHAPKEVKRMGFQVDSANSSVQGALFLMQEAAESWKLRYCLLDKASFRWTRQGTTGKKAEGSFALSDVEKVSDSGGIHAAPAGGERTNMFSVVLESGDVFVLCAPSAVEREVWILIFQKNAPRLSTNLFSSKKITSQAVESRLHELEDEIFQTSAASSLTSTVYVFEPEWGYVDSEVEWEAPTPDAVSTASRMKMILSVVDGLEDEDEPANDVDGGFGEPLDEEGDVLLGLMEDFTETAEFDADDARRTLESSFNGTDVAKLKLTMDKVVARHAQKKVPEKTHAGPQEKVQSAMVLRKMAATLAGDESDEDDLLPPAVMAPLPPLSAPRKPLPQPPPVLDRDSLKALSDSGFGLLKLQVPDGVALSDSDESDDPYKQFSN